MNLLPSYDDFSEMERAEFRQALSRLLYEGSLQWILEEDRSAYELLAQRYQEINDYLSFFDTQLVVNEESQFMYYEPLEGSKGLIKLRTRDELTLLMILRIELETARQKGELPHRIPLNDLRNQYEGRIGKTIPTGRFKDILRDFRKLKLISYSRGGLESWDNSILILPLVFILTLTRIDEMEEIIRLQLPEDGASE